MIGHPYWLWYLADDRAPVALGNGLPLFKDLPNPLRVDLAEARSFPDGTVIHVYRPIRTTG